jgi:hypothetical protein
VDKNLEFTDIGVYFILIALILGFIYLAVFIAGSESEAGSEEEIKEIREELLQDLNNIEEKLVDIENVPEE